MSTRMSFPEQIKKAKKKVRKLKTVLPEAFPEYSRMLAAEVSLKEAQAEYKAARKAWKSLGR